MIELPGVIESGMPRRNGSESRNHPRVDHSDARPGCMTTRQYARLLSEWIASIGLDPHLFGTQFPETNQGDADLPPDRQPVCRAAIARPHQD
jgi:hypothetical protein